VLWEFTDKDHPGDLGYVFDAPTLVKTVRYGWVVLVASGYNNPSGKGILYVLNPTNGAVLKRLSPDEPADLDPLSERPEPATATKTAGPFHDPRLHGEPQEPICPSGPYGGDLSGNVWRFDLSDPDESKWKVALIAKLTVGGVAQPITTGVRVEIDQTNNVDRYLFVGTGKLLDQADVPDAPGVTNSLYVIRDGTRTAPGAVLRGPIPVLISILSMALYRPAFPAPRQAAGGIRTAARARKSLPTSPRMCRPSSTPSPSQRSSARTF
jgi:type IV pilus assembly protein PilY1